MSAPAVEAWVEPASSYSYPAVMRAEREAEAAGVALLWRPFLLGPIFRAQGWEDSPFNLHPAKGRYMWRDLARICAAQGLALRPPEAFPANGLRAARVATAGEGAPWQGAFLRAVYLAGFGRGEDIAEPAVLAAALAEAGGPAEALEAAGRQEVKDRLRARTEEAAALGLFGAPSFVVRTGGAPEIFWGQDRLAQAIAWARGEGRAP